MSEKVRSKRVGLRLSEELASRLDEYANSIGIAPSTVAAQAVGEYLHKKSMEQKLISDFARTSSIVMAKEMAKNFSDPEKIKQFQEHGLMLDEDEVKAFVEEQK